MISEQVVIEMD